MKRFNIFPGIIFVLLGMNFLIVGITVYAANSDGGAAIEPDYYQKALAWDEHRAQEQRNLELGWDAQGRLTRRSGTLTLAVNVTDREGAAITGAAIRAVAFRNLEAKHRHQLLLREASPGTYESAVPAAGGGQWHIELLVESRGRVFTRSLDASPEDAP